MRTPDPGDPRNDRNHRNNRNDRNHRHGNHGHHRKHRPGRPRAARNGNPLRRPADRLRFCVDILLMVVLIIGLPLAGWAAGSLTYDHYQGVTHSQNLGKHRVTAHLTADTSHLVPVALPGGSVGSAPVTWTDASGKHTGRTVAFEGQKKGAAIRVWVDRADRITVPPENSSAGLTAGVSAGIVAAATAGALVSGARAGFHRSLDRRLDARWEKEWSLVEPKWSHRSDR
ncbi:hypothetical protein ACIOGX_05210 [Streptomyces sp. NPDC088147]|uniref:Rv1733c family protein n=1 Tax=Streptomyces sp. NPDC088147 TaxID=3365830 RepID=UPI00382E1F0E